MLVLVPGNEIAEERVARTLMLFGTGLIGSAIRSRLIGDGWLIVSDTAYAWHDVRTQEQQARSYAAFLRDQIAVASCGSRIDIVWSAGKGGFASSDDVFNHEWTSFRTILGMAERLQDTVRDCSTVFHLISSAGGLFEGQTFVDRLSVPAPKRPYGQAKLRQEDALFNSSLISRHHIYRPSSVYGFTPDGRAGLISTLVMNGLARRPTNIVGNPYTLRDFVFTDDIAKFVRDCIMDEGRISRTHLLASAKATSTLEIISILEETLRIPLFLQYATKPSNALDNSFRASAIAEGFQPTNLAVGIRQTVSRAHSMLL